MQVQANTCVNYHDAKYPRNGKCFNFSLCLRFYFTCVNWDNAKANANARWKILRSMPLWFTFKPRWRPPPPSLILLPESSFPDCWSRVIQTLRTRLPPSWDTEMGMLISFCMRLRSTCVMSLALALELMGLHLRFKYEPALNHYPVV